MSFGSLQIIIVNLDFALPDLLQPLRLFPLDFASEVIVVVSAE